jgi:hypothetical protein
VTESKKSLALKKGLATDVGVTALEGAVASTTNKLMEATAAASAPSSLKIPAAPPEPPVGAATPAPSGDAPPAAPASKSDPTPALRSVWIHDGGHPGMSTRTKVGFGILGAVVLVAAGYLVGGLFRTAPPVA